MYRLRIMRLCFLSIIVGAIACACTRNNGDIGDWFGTWKMESMIIDDGAVDAGYDDNIIWKFQSDIISIVQVDDTEHDAMATYGRWAQIDDRLLLNFSFSDNNGVDQYTPPAVTRIPRGESTMSIIELSRSHIRLLYKTYDNHTIVYTLNKWG